MTRTLHKIFRFLLTKPVFIRILNKVPVGSFFGKVILSNHFGAPRMATSPGGRFIVQVSKGIYIKGPGQWVPPPSRIEPELTMQVGMAMQFNRKDLAENALSSVRKFGDFPNAIITELRERQLVPFFLKRV